MLLYEMIKELIDPKLPLVSNLSNASSILNKLDNINWCGFYLAEGDALYLGPFQGEVACTIIPFGKGVCGSAALKKETIIVPNVNEFPGHIACSALSKSEIVTPIIKDGKCVGVIDIDSPILNRFGNTEKEELEKIAKLLERIF